MRIQPGLAGAGEEVTTASKRNESIPTQQILDLFYDGWEISEIASTLRVSIAIVRGVVANSIVEAERANESR